MKVTPEQLLLAARPVLEAGRAVSFNVAGNSMYPFLKDGDLVTVRKKECYRPGDIVLARDSFTGSVVLHYIVCRAGCLYKLMGASNLVQEEFCRPADIAGGLESPPISRALILLWNGMLPMRRHLLWLLRKFHV